MTASSGVYGRVYIGGIQQEEYTRVYLGGVVGKQYLPGIPTWCIRRACTAAPASNFCLIRKECRGLPRPPELLANKGGSTGEPSL